MLACNGLCRGRRGQAGAVCGQIQGMAHSPERVWKQTVVVRLLKIPSLLRCTVVHSAFGLCRLSLFQSKDLATVFKDKFEECQAELRAQAGAKTSKPFVACN